MILRKNLWKSPLRKGRLKARAGYLFFSLVIPAVTSAQIFDGQSLSERPLDEVVQQIGPGTIVVMGEIHDNQAHHENQVSLMAALKAKGLPFNLGMEFLEYPDQKYVDAFLRGNILESEFLKLIGWSGLPFDFYRRQVLLPLSVGGWTFGINLPRTITRKVSQSGLTSLTDDERALLPPNFTLGNAAYYQRFSDVMKDHVPPEALERFFISQSLWDDTMAWQALRRAETNPDKALVVIVGDFHAAWGGGLPDRLKARGARNVINISQVLDRGEVQIHPSYGARGDFIWVAK